MKNKPPEVNPPLSPSDRFVSLSSESYKEGMRQKLIAYLGQRHISELKEKVKHLEASNDWRSCARCIYFLPGYPQSTCNALRSLPQNTTTENNCPDFEKNLRRSYWL